MWGSSSGDVFAVGETGTILRYDGTSWNPMRSGAGARILGVWGSSRSDVFAVGGSGTILHNDGNTAPLVIGDSYTTTEDSLLHVPAPGLLANDTDEEGDSLTIIDHTQPKSGTVTLGGDGAFSYQPVTNFCGPDRFTYTVSDGHSSPMSSAVTIDVTCVNTLYLPLVNR